jgi:hypothetical protein
MQAMGVGPPNVAVLVVDMAMYVTFVTFMSTPMWPRIADERKTKGRSGSTNDLPVRGMGVLYRLIKDVTDKY